MKEQTRIRLGIIAARFGRSAAVRSESERDWLAAFDALRAGLLRTAMREIGDVLAQDGNRHEIRLDAETDAHSIDFAVTPAGLSERERIIRFFARNDERRGWQVIAKIWLSASPSELTRFELPAEITAEVAEQLLADAVEQTFASARAGRAGGEA